MAQIKDLGLDARLAEAAAALGWSEPTSLQQAAIPVLRRGASAVLHASSGAGITGAYMLPLLDRLAQPGGDGIRALVLVPTEDGAERIAQQLAALAAPVEVRVHALAEGWPRTVRGDVVVATPPVALAALERSELKVDAVECLVLVDFDLMHRLGGADAVETLTPLVPREAQRVVTAAELTPEIERYAEAHLRRALTIPARAADTRERTTPETTGALSYVIVPEAQKLTTLVRLLGERAGERLVVVTRSEGSADRLRASLGQRGFDTSNETGVRVEAAQNAPASGVQISFDVPFDTELLRSLHRAGGLVLVTPREVSHLRRVAAEAGLALKAERIETGAADAVSEYRRMLRQAIHDEDVAAQLTVLEPLFDEFGAAQVAAALSALYRRRHPPAAAPRAGTGKPAEGATAFVRLFISLGERDNVRPADLVGAIAGEANIKGDQVGKIDIRDTFSVVEIATAVADKVIRALNGTTLRGRAVRVDYDRKSSGPPASRSSREGPPRGGPRGGAPRGGPARGGPPRGGPRDRPPRDRPPREG